jgi:ABC-type phosphate transport system substrate-binding protein
MKRASVTGAIALCLGLTVACGGGSNETEIAEREPEVTGRGEGGRSTTVTETGCVTAEGDRFVLTALESGAAGDQARQDQGGANPTAKAQPTTQSYQLIGNGDELRQLVGQQVRVTGEADPPKVAEVRESSPPTDASGATGTAGQAEPAKPGEPRVSATTETRLEVTQLRVQSIMATGEACPAR